LNIRSWLKASLIGARVRHKDIGVISRDRLFILNIFRCGLDVEHPDQRAARVAAVLKSIKKARWCKA
jgi:hypothetical protein